MKFKSDIEVQAGLKDSSGAIGASGQVLSSTGSNVSWINQTTIANDVQNLVKAGVAINKGQAVYVTGADGTNIIVGLASNTSEATSSKTLGLLNATVAINGMADVVQIGRLAGLNTIGAVAGDPVWLGTNGNLIYGLTNKPYAPAHLVFIGVVTRVNSNNGEIFINVQNGFELNEIHDVDLKTTVPINGDILGYNGTLWVNKTIAGWLGYTPANASGTTNYVSKFTGSTSLGNSQLFDNGTNVGIGTTSPQRKLDVVGNHTTSTFRVYYPELNVAGQDASVDIWASEPGISYNGSGIGSNVNGQPYYGRTNPALGQAFLRFITGNIMFHTSTADAVYSERMRIDSSGNIGINTSSPSERFQVNGNIAIDSLELNVPKKIKFNANRNTFGTYGDIEWYNYQWDGLIKASISAETSGALSNGTLIFKTSDGGSNASERMRILGNGNIGIGTSNPGFATTGRTVLTLNGPTSALMEFQNGGIFKSYLFQGPGGFEIYDISNIQFSVNGGERMRVASNGNVGIGTTSPTDKLQVNGGKSIFASSNFNNTNAGGAVFVFSDDNNGGKIWAQKNGNSDWGYLSLQPLGGNVGIGTTSPTQKLSINGNAQIDEIFVGVTTGFLSGTSNAQIGWAGGFSGLTNGTLILQSRSNVATPIIFATSTTEKMRIDGNGNVGIGTTSPNVELALYQATTPRFHLQNSTSGTGSASGFQIALNSNDSYLWNWQNGATIFATNGSERMRITSAGNVGIGTTDTFGFKTLINSGNSSNNLILFSTTSGVNLTFNDLNTGVGSQIVGVANDLYVSTNNAERMRIASNGNIGIGTSNPLDKLDVLGNQFLGDGANTTQLHLRGVVNVSYAWNIKNLATGYQVKSTSPGSGDGFNIDFNNNVGIGTTSPLSRLQIAGALGATVGQGGSTIRLLNTDTGAVAAITAGITGVTNEGMQFSTDGTARMVINNGNVGIGTTSPSSNLTVIRNANNSSYVTTFGNTNAGTSASTISEWSVSGYSSFVIGKSNSDGRVEIAQIGNNNIDFINNGTNVMSIDTNQNVIVNGTTAEACAQLEIKSETKGFLPPRMSDADRDNISSPVEGLMIYNTTQQTINFYDGTTWQRVAVV